MKKKTAKSSQTARPHAKAQKKAAHRPAKKQPAMKAKKTMAKKTVGPRRVAKMAKAAGKKTMGKAAKMKMAKKPAPRPVHKKPAASSQPTVMESARGVFARFAGPQVKELVRQAASSAKLSMNAYVGLAALNAAKENREVKIAVEPPASPATGRKVTEITEYNRRVFVRFKGASGPKEKMVIEKSATAAGVSLSAYITHFAVAAAEAGWKPEMEEEKTAASA